MGEEEIRAHMEIEKIKLSAGLGAMFTVVIVLFIATSKPFETAPILPLFIAIGFTVVAVIFASIITKIVLIPSRDRFIDLAKELDRLKRKQKAH